jgi:RNA polymerase sigma factor (TIGR02999 family)
MDPSTLESREGEVTRLLEQINQGDRDAMDRLLPLVYEELRRLANRYFRSERSDHTLQPTALVHEAWLRLVGQKEAHWQNHLHFIAVAATTMRHILVDYARSHAAEQHGGHLRKIELNEAIAAAPGSRQMEILAVDDALRRLEALDAQQARVVELRFFGGLSIEETAEAMKLSRATVNRYWNFARAWLLREMGKSAHDDKRALAAHPGTL